MPSAKVCGESVSIAGRARQDSVTAGASSDCTPITWVAGRCSGHQGRAADAAAQTNRHQNNVRFGSSSKISSAKVPTPAIRSGSLAEWT